MSFSVNANLHQPSLSCGTMLYSGLKLKPTGVFQTGPPNLTAGFFGKVDKSLRCGIRNHKPIRASITMMPVGTPRVPYKTPGEGTWQLVDVTQALHRDGIIFIGDMITEDFSNQILATMLYLDSVEDVKKMFLYFSCPGGDVPPTLALYDTMKSLKTTVGTHNLGYAYNLAGFLLAAGDKGHRTSVRLSRVSLRSPTGAARGQADHILNEAKELVKIKDYLSSELSMHTGQPAEKIKNDLTSGRSFSAKAALEYGLIDRIIRPPPITVNRIPGDGLPGLG